MHAVNPFSFAIARMAPLASSAKIERYRFHAGSASSELIRTSVVNNDQFSGLMGMGIGGSVSPGSGFGVGGHGGCGWQPNGSPGLPQMNEQMVCCGVLTKHTEHT